MQTPELPTGQIRTLGLYQPFAGLMVSGKIETRRVKTGRKAPFPIGYYLLYATQKEYPLDKVKTISGNQYSKILQIRADDPTSLCQITGHAICIGQLCKRFRIFDNSFDEKTFVQYYFDPEYALIGLEFRDVRKIAPFPFRGKQGVGFLSADDRAKIKFI